MVETLTFDGQQRRVMTVPYAPGAPLAVLLHSASTSLESFAALLDLSKFAGLNLVLPEHQPRWIENVRTQGPSDIDVRFIDHAISRAVAMTGATRICMAGFSSGAFMVSRFLHEPQGARVSRAAMVAGAVLTAYTQWNVHRVPMLMVNGTEDTRTIYNGVLGMLSAPASASYWANGEAFTDERLPNPKADGTSVTLRHWPSTRLYTVNGGGHTWPGSRKNLPGSGNVSMDIDASSLVRAWFVG